MSTSDWSMLRHVHESCRSEVVLHMSMPFQKVKLQDGFSRVGTHVGQPDITIKVWADTALFIILQLYENALTSVMACRYNVEHYIGRWLEAWRFGDVSDLYFLGHKTSDLSRFGSARDAIRSPVVRSQCSCDCVVRGHKFVVNCPMKLKSSGQNSDTSLNFLCLS